MNPNPCAPADAPCLVSLTRLRLASWHHLPGFAWLTLRAARQARRAPGFRGLRLLADRRLTFWTATAWCDEASMVAYRGRNPHAAAMRRLSEWCDEASVVRWTGPVSTLDDWPAAAARMRTEGRSSRVRRPSPDHEARSWPDPRVGTPRR